jgi:acetylornithine deacetylase/succinyl-diaminopimelate desuccinylase-like protein
MSIEQRVAAEVPRALEDLRVMVAIPSVSSMPQHAEDVSRSAELVASLLAAEGVTCRVVTTGGARPAVLGHKRGPAGAPTVLLYAHHDVQPVGDLAEWSADPWVAAERDGRLFGRGTSDDKGAVALQLALLRAFGDDLPVSLVFLVEGEEEIGSPRFDALLAEHEDELTADVVVVPDAVNPDPLTPSVTTALRGNADLVMTLATLTRPVHSGLYGGAAPCALTTLVATIGRLYDESGALAVPGLEPEVGTGVQVLLDVDEVLLPGVRQLGTGPLADRLVSAPSITVLAIDATPVADASNVLHPSARAKLGVRLPPGGDPDDVLTALEDRLRTLVPAGAVVSFERGPGGAGFRSAHVPAAWAVAAEKAYGRASVDVGVGGSIPFVRALADLLPKAAFLVTALQDSQSKAHSFDESLHLEGFEKACIAHALLLEGLAEGAAAT